MLTSLRSVCRRWSVELNSPNRRVRTRMHGGVTGTAGDSLPMSIPESPNPALWHLLDAPHLVRYNIDRLMTRTRASVALVCALVGLFAAGEAAYVHYRMLRDPTYVSFCDVST